VTELAQCQARQGRRGSRNQPLPGDYSHAGIRVSQITDRLPRRLRPVPVKTEPLCRAWGSSDCRICGPPSPSIGARGADAASPWAMARPEAWEPVFQGSVSASEGSKDPQVRQIHGCRHRAQTIHPLSSASLITKAVDPFGRLSSPTGPCPGPGCRDPSTHCSFPSDSHRLSNHTPKPTFGILCFAFTSNTRSTTAHAARG
jgi:hypothetical protein